MRKSTKLSMTQQPSAMQPARTATLGAHTYTCSAPKLVFAATPVCMLQYIVCSSCCMRASEDKLPSLVMLVPCRLIPVSEDLWVPEVQQTLLLNAQVRIKIHKVSVLSSGLV